MEKNKMSNTDLRNLIEEMVNSMLSYLSQEAVEVMDEHLRESTDILGPIYALSDLADKAETPRKMHLYIYSIGVIVKRAYEKGVI